LKYRLHKLGYYRMPCGMMKGLIVPQGWIVETWDEAEQRWFRTHPQMLPADAEALTNSGRPVTIEP